MSASNHAVNTFVIEPISNTVADVTGRSSLRSSRPQVTMRLRCGVTTHTAIPTVRLSTSTRRFKISRMALSSSTSSARALSAIAAAPTAAIKALRLSMPVVSMFWEYAVCRCRLRPPGRQSCSIENLPVENDFDNTVVSINRTRGIFCQ